MVNFEFTRKDAKSTKEFLIFFKIYYFFQIITINIMRGGNVKKLGEDK